MGPSLIIPLGMFKVKLRAVFLALTLCANCVPVPRDYTYIARSGEGPDVRIMPMYIDERWEAEEKALLQEAITEWNKTLNGQIVLRVMSYSFHVPPKHDQADDFGYILIRTDTTNPLTREPEHLLSNAWAQGPGGGLAGNRVYFVRDRFPLNELQRIAMHEIGHMLGSGHIGKNVLMSPSIIGNNYDCIDETAVRAVAAYRQLDLREMRWCSR